MARRKQTDDNDNMDLLDSMINDGIPTVIRQETPAEKIIRLEAKVAEQEKIIECFTKDGMYAYYFAMNRKANETADSLNSFVLSLVSDDKTFERYCKVISIQATQTAALDALRKDYLKLPEEKLNEIEKTGVPLIERRRENKKNK